MKFSLSKKNVSIIDRRKGLSDRIVFSIAFVIFLIYALSIIIFYGWAIMSSLKSVNDFLYHPLKFPTSFEFKNYVTAYKELVVNDTNFIGLLWNSIWYTLGSSALYVFFHLCTSYIFTKFNFRFKKIMYFFIILYMVMPLYGAQAAYYRLIYTLNIANSPLFLITFMGGFTGGTFLILSAAWETLDKTYNEAASIDGASLWQTFTKLMIPMVLGPTFAVFILQFIGNWNQYEVFVMFLDKLPNLSYGIYRFNAKMLYQSQDPVFFAGITMTIIPVLIFFAIFANKIMDSISFGSGIKG